MRPWTAIYKAGEDTSHHGRRQATLMRVGAAVYSAPYDANKAWLHVTNELTGKTLLALIPGDHMNKLELPKFPVM